MGRFILISGPNDSGKSRFAEGLTDRLGGIKRLYIATMVPQTPENEVRVARHRAQREGLGFVTAELPDNVGEAPAESDSAVLLEDVSNLLGNHLFAAGGQMGEVYRDILRLRDRCALLLAVTISGLTPEGYRGETADYIRDLNRLNDLLSDAADAAVTMENGVPLWVKGGEHDPS